MRQLVIYIAGPYRAFNRDGTSDEFQVSQNVREAMALGLEVWRRGMVALCPHANTMSLTGADGIPEAVWIDGDLELLLRCDAVLLTARWRLSTGASAEKRFAERHGLPVFESVQHLDAWRDSTPGLKPLSVVWRGAR